MEGAQRVNVETQPMVDVICSLVAGFRSEVFDRNSAIGFLFTNTSIRTAYSSLLEAVMRETGLFLLTGAAGVGKTALLGRLTLELEAEGFHVISSYQPGLAFGKLISILHHETSTADLPYDCPWQWFGQVQADLATLRKSNSPAVLVIDEAEKLGGEVILNLHSLLQLPDGKSTPLRIVLSGRPEIERRLELPVLAALKSALVVRSRLERIGNDHIGAYISHRLRWIGYKGPDLFTEGAIAAIIDHAQGLPRRINLLCEHALLLASREGAGGVSPDIINRVARELLAPTSDERSSAQAQWSFRSLQDNGRRVSMGLLSAVSVALGAMVVLAPLQPPSAPFAVAPDGGGSSSPVTVDPDGARMTGSEPGQSLGAIPSGPGSMDSPKTGLNGTSDPVNEPLAADWSLADGHNGKAKSVDLELRAPSKAPVAGVGISTPGPMPVGYEQQRDGFSAAATEKQRPVSGKTAAAQSITESAPDNVKPNELQSTDSKSEGKSTDTHFETALGGVGTPQSRRHDSQTNAEHDAASSRLTALKYGSLIQPEVEDLLTMTLKRGDELLATGDIAGARRFYERAAAAGSARGAMEAGRTHDPLFLRESRVLGMQPDPAKAAEWYRRATSSGDRAAEIALQRLTAFVGKEPN